MTKNRKPGARPDELLDELSSLQSLLGDAARDVPFAAGDDEIPVLPPETTSAAKNGAYKGAARAGDAPEHDAGTGDEANQIPLLDPAPGGNQDRDATLRRTAMTRENPFLAPSRPSANPSTDDLEKRIARASPAAATSAAASGSGRGNRPVSTPGAPVADEATMRALVDELLAQWLPRIERELCDRLMEELRQRRD